MIIKRTTATDVINLCEARPFSEADLCQFYDSVEVCTWSSVPVTELCTFSVLQRNSYPNIQLGLIWVTSDFCCISPLYL